MPENDEQAAKLHYINNANAALFEAGRRENRVASLYLVLSLLIIFLIAGTVSVDDRLSFGGIVISAPISLLLLGAALLVAIANYYDVALVADQELRRQEILGLYQSLGFTPDRTLMQGQWSAFLYPDASSVVIRALGQSIVTPLLVNPFTSSLPQIIKTKKAPKSLALRGILMVVVSGLMLLGLFLLPLCAEGLAVVFAVRQQGMSSLIGLVIVALVVMNLATSIVAGQQSLDGARQGFHTAIGTVLSALQTSEPDTQAPTTKEDDDANLADTGEGSG